MESISWYAEAATPCFPTSSRPSSTSLGLSPPSRPKWRHSIFHSYHGSALAVLLVALRILYFRALPDSCCKRGVFKRHYKVSKERVTLMFKCSSTGEKLQPLVIGKSKKPRCFKNIDLIKKLYLYTAVKKTWMTSTIFSVWITDVNKVMKRPKADSFHASFSEQYLFRSTYHPSRA